MENKTTEQAQPESSSSLWNTILNFGEFVFGKWGKGQGQEQDDDKVDNDNLEETRASSRKAVDDLQIPHHCKYQPLEQQYDQIRAQLADVKRLVQETHATIHSLPATGDGDDHDHVKQNDEVEHGEGTTLTNYQVFELEKQFLYQKNLPTADQVEIAERLRLTKAQVKTWFKDRRAKLESDMEELKKNITN